MERPSALGRIDELFGDERRPEQFDLELTAERLVNWFPGRNARVESSRVERPKGR